jgi:flagellar hook-associated protein 1 FlgK
MSNINLFQYNGQSLSAIQVAIKNVSDNVAHAQDPNYQRRDTVFNDVAGVVVKVDKTRAVNLDLRAQVLDANTAVAGLDESKNIYDNLSGIIGTSNNNTGYLETKLQAVQAAWSQYESTPQSAAAESAVVSTSDAFASQVRSIYTSIRNAISSENASVQTDVTNLNQNLTDLQALNVYAINEKGSVTGVTPETQDKIDTLLTSISKFVPVIAFQNSNGSVSVFTKNGIPLVDKIANSFSWDPVNYNIYATGGTAPTSYGGAGSLNTAFSSGTIGAKILALDPTSPPTAGTSPQQGIFQKYRSQLNAFVDLFANGTAPAANSAFDAAFTQGPSDRTTDIVQQVTAGAAGVLAQGAGFFTTSASVNPVEETFAVNSSLLNGTATINRQSAASVISFFTSQTNNLGATGAAGTTTVGGNTPVGGLSLVNRTPQGIVSGISAAFAANQATIAANDTTATTTQQDTLNRLQSQTSVNTDDELARLQVLQNQYAATGRLLSAADSLFQTLIAIQ